MDDYNVPFGPTVYGKLRDFALEQPMQQSRETLERISGDAVNQMVYRIDEMLRQAYMQGIRNGFAQGVMTTQEAQEKTEENNNET